MILKSSYPLSLEQTVLSHGWYQLAPWNWDSINGILSRNELFEDGYSRIINCSQHNAESILIHLPPSDSKSVDDAYIRRCVTRWLSLDWDPTPAIELSSILDPEICFFLKNGGGRFLRGTSFYEDCIKTILTINANWKFTIRMANDICRQLGEGRFPTPISIINAGPTVLKNYLHLGFRAEVIYETTKQLLDREIINEGGTLEKNDLCYEDMIHFRGLGPYSVHHILMLMHNFETIPIDSEVVSYCNKILKIERNDIQEHFTKWGKYRFLGYKLRRIIDSLQTNR